MDFQTGIGIVFRKERNKTNLSQEKLALSINMDRTYYASVEAGKRNISLNNIVKISHGLNVQPSDILKQVEDLISNNNL